MPFYMALVVEKEKGTMDGVVEETKQILRKELPSKEYQDHADRITEADPMIFERYRIKPLYVLLVFAFQKLGFSFIHATLVSSLICYFLIGLTVWRILITRLEPFKTLLVSVVCMLILPVLILARLSTPDAISCLLLLNAISFIYSGGSKAVWYSLLILAICTRLDNVVSELIILFSLWKWPTVHFSNKLSTREFFIMSGVLMTMAMLVNLTSTHQFLWFMDHNFSVPRSEYLKSLTLYFYVLPGSFFMYLLIMFVISGLKRGYGWKQEINYFFYTVCTVVFVRFVLYPYYEERYLTPYLLFSVLILCFDSGTLGISEKEVVFNKGQNT